MRKEEIFFRQKQSLLAPRLITGLLVLRFLYNYSLEVLATAQNFGREMIIEKYETK